MEIAKQSAPVQSVRKAMDLLDRVVFAPSGRAPTLTQLAGELGIRTNTAHNLLKSLEACGYAGRDGAGGGYVPGYKLRQVGLLNRALSPEAARRLQAALDDLAARVGELVLYAVLSGPRRITLAFADGAPEPNIQRAPDPAPQLYSVPTGRVLLACAAGPQRRNLIDALGQPDPDHWAGVRTRRELDAALDAIARDGFCVQSTAGGRYASFAVPVYDGHDGLAGSLGCMAGAADWPDTRHDEMISALSACARRLGL
jgi:DNA-binding IclR family transcriptional regulator